MRAKKLQAVRIPKKGLIDFDVVWGKGEQAFAARLIASWNRSRRQYRFLVTNLPRNRYSARALGQVYRLRWQIELLFKEWKSYANLHAFNTRNRGIAEGLIWAAGRRGGDETLSRPYDADAARRGSVHPKGRHVRPSGT